MNKKTRKINLINMIVISIIFLFELMQESVKIVFSNGEGKPPRVEFASYLADCELLLAGLSILTLIIAIFTIAIIILNSIVLIEDSVKLTIVSTVLTSICLLGSVILVALIRKYVTVQNLIIMILFLIIVTLNSVKLHLLSMRVEKN